jgi:hypothetical protein
MRTRILTATAVLVAVLCLAGPALATGGNECKKHCPPPPAEPIEQVRCDTTAALRIVERDLPNDPATQLVTVEATNTNAATQTATLVVTYEANRISGVEHVLFVAHLRGGDVVQTTIEVPRWRDVDGQVVASIDDLGCDDQHESVRLFS